MRCRRRTWSAGTAALVLMAACTLVSLSVGQSFSAYHHMGEIDSGNFLAVYPEKAGTKLDSCNLCHSGGSYVDDNTKKTVTLGSCQWCHYKTEYGKKSTPENLEATLNLYGLHYRLAGRSATAVQNIAGQDSDGDGYTNADEVAAVRYPGDPADDPTKVPAPYRVFTREQLLQMPQHRQFQLMNASKSDDFYALYSGVTLESLLDDLLLESATGATAYAPDGFSQYHPLYPDSAPALYHVFGDYPSAEYYYNSAADMAKNPSTGWCRYDAPSAAGRSNGDPITNADGLKLLLAIKRDGQNLTTGVLTLQNKLDGEGPFRVVPPQKLPGQPDQRSTVKDWTGVWPYNVNADHNAGFSTRSTTIIKVEPLPEGTTDINVMEAGWPYVDEANRRVWRHRSGAEHPGKTRRDPGGSRGRIQEGLPEPCVQGTIGPTGQDGRVARQAGMVCAGPRHASARASPGSRRLLCPSNTPQRRSDYRLRPAEADLLVTQRGVRPVEHRQDGRLGSTATRLPPPSALLQARQAVPSR